MVSVAYGMSDKDFQMQSSDSGLEELELTSTTRIIAPCPCKCRKRSFSTVKKVQRKCTACLLRRICKFSSCLMLDGSLGVWCCDRGEVKKCPNKCTDFSIAKAQCKRCMNKSCEVLKCRRKNGKKGRMCSSTVEIIPSPSPELVPEVV